MRGGGEGEGGDEGRIIRLIHPCSPLDSTLSDLSFLLDSSRPQRSRG